MVSRDYSNPSDNSFGGYTQRVQAVVVDVDDPNQAGRVRCRLIGLQEQIPDEDLPWISCMHSNQPSNKGIGFFPHNYMVGSKVLLTSTGSQGFVIEGSLPNTDKTKNNKDINEEAEDNTPLFLLKNLGIHEELLKKKGTKDALALLNGKTNLNWLTTEDIYKEIINEAKVPAHYNKRTKAKSQTIPSIGVEKFAGEMISAQKFIKGKIGDAGSVIPGALDMLTNLHNMKSPLSVPFATGLAGVSNLLSAAKGLIDLIKKNKEENDTEEKTEEEQTAEDILLEELEESVTILNEETPTS